MRRFPLALFTVVAFIACGDDDGTPAGSGGSPPTTTVSTGGSGASGGGSASCSGAFTFLQKDAYKETAGRTSALWPPHTTTTLAWSCDDGSTGDAFRANHGTEPGETDANGDVFLVETGSVSIAGDPTTLTALGEAYDACECGTAFLSLDALGDQAVQDLVAALSTYITDNLTCSGSVDAAGLVDLLQQGQIEAVLAELPMCTWAAGFDWEAGFDEALSAIIDTANETLADYHVCNNDAALQAKLIQGFVDRGTVTACDASDPICSGPLWYYEP